MRETQWIRVWLLMTLLGIGVSLYAQDEDCGACKSGWVVGEPHCVERAHILFLSSVLRRITTASGLYRWTVVA